MVDHMSGGLMWEVLCRLKCYVGDFGSSEVLLSRSYVVAPMQLPE